MTRQGFIENIITMLLTVSLVLGLYHMSNSFHALWGLMLLINLNAPAEK